MLVKLKQYLKKVYGLKDKACTSFNPSDKADIRSSAITPVRPLELPSLSSKSTSKSKSANSNSSIKAYAEQYELLKCMVDSDTSDSVMYSNGSSSSGTKQPDVDDDVER